ncbi:MAG: hypothetical protein HQK81_14080 [Desulfovibrionaceae bacterium]|nr:hypothetical protein [Desulfovibrionaceae bacterium]MBF0515172.1 hypothetical protein [Desulfovibrionaceae bacterium]
MKLVVEIAGSIDTVRICSLPRSFVARIFTHCLGKNNTPYFANNCFKGVLYFDTDFARRLAAKDDFAWSDWTQAKAYYAISGIVHDSNLRLCASLDGASCGEIGVTHFTRTLAKIDFSALAPALPEGHIAVLLGSVDKGSEILTLQDGPETFDPAKLALTYNSFEDFRFEDVILSRAAYDGREMTRAFGTRKGKNMLDPLLFSGPGEELDLYDFTGELRPAP